MTNEDNPYGNFLEIIRKEAHVDGDAPFFIGTVVQPNPLIVKIGDLQIEQENMKVNQALLAGYSRRMSMGTAGATGSTRGAMVSAASGFPEGHLPRRTD